MSDKNRIMQINIEEKVFMVAASSRGLGYGIALELAKNGATVCIASKTKENIEQAAKQIRNLTSSKVQAYTFDAENAASIKQWSNAVLNEFNRIDGLVINAGGPPPGNFDDFSDQDWETAYNLTLMSAVRLIREVLPFMKAQKEGSILTVTSLSVKEPIDGLLLSNVFRSGVTSLVKSLSRELASRNIRINNLMPGRFDTDRIRSLDQQAAEKKDVTIKHIRKQHESAIPVGRYGTAEEFGKAAAFLLSDAASYITGVSLAVDGGLIRTVW